MKTTITLLLSLLFTFCTSNQDGRNPQWNYPITESKAQIKSVNSSSVAALPEGKVSIGDDIFITSTGNKLFRVNLRLNTTDHIAGSGSSVHSDGAVILAGIPTTKGLGRDENGVIYILYLDQIRTINLITDLTTSLVFVTPLSGIITSQFVSGDGSTIYYTMQNDSRVYQVNTTTGAIGIHSGGAGGDSVGTRIGSRFMGPEIIQTEAGYSVIDFYPQKIKSVEGTDVLNRSCKLKVSSLTSSLGVDGPADSCSYGYITSYFYNRATREIYFIESWSVIRRMNSDGSVITLGRPFSLNFVDPITNILYANGKVFFSTNGGRYEAELQ